MKTSFLALAGLGLVAACAQSPGSIAPVSMDAAYFGVSCPNAQTMLIGERQRLAALESKQRGAVVGDAVGVLLIAVPVSSLVGADVAGDVAVSKGKVIALENRLMTCR